ncbi:P pilus assembly protein, chaperone PapD [Nostoc sp. MBR 210]|uniref:Molecular chaperone n=1 Tax=Nostoc spongiaeforme FACHB-130 TaxID=1357510 RepID=A0ABR8FYD6_9NOSO|nr:fimbria/pilus periplasmic chaperone [Nostoc spongiaeforme]MBD2595360.1 molecular chaperone [Nostoc spongiaeforme FACHB-130]OCQ90050.1 P pilus assembly protein, chaperone PapD [Nostoc sp. MBR 210]
MNQQQELVNRLYKIGTTALLTLSTFAFNCNHVLAIAIGVSPPRFELKLDDKKPKTQVFRVVNIDNQPATFRIYIQGWILNEENEIQPVKSTEQSLDNWITVNPVSFTLPPGKTQTVRFSVRPRVKPQAGEHRALIFVEEVKSNQEKKPSSGVKVLGRFGVAVYAYVGSIKKVGVLNSISVDGKSNNLKAAFDISSQGNAYVRMNGQYAVWSANKYPGASGTKQIANLQAEKNKKPDGVLDAGMLPSTPVLPGTRRQLILNITKKLPPGQYVLDVNGDLNGSAIDKGIPFTVTARSK